MDPIGAFPDGEWYTLSPFIPSEDQLDFIPHFLSQISFPLEHEGLNCPPTVCSNAQPNVGVAGLNDSWFYSLDSFTSDNNCLVDPSSHGNYNLHDFNQIPLVNNDTGSFFPEFAADILLGKTFCANEDVGFGRYGYLDDTHQAADAAVPDKNLHLKRKFDAGNSIPLSGNPKKKIRVSQGVQKISKKNNAQSKKNQKVNPKGKGELEEAECNVGVSDGQSCSSSSSEDDSASQENNGANSDSIAGEAIKLNGKMRASRGSATDPQSLYARKRRERINERLRILQKLIPNGTKVDISTMLEEAVHYVKFMQLQIKLLSSDELWMYAPIAYNGFDIGLQQNISPFLLH